MLKHLYPKLTTSHGSKGSYGYGYGVNGLTIKTFFDANPSKKLIIIIDLEIAAKKLMLKSVGTEQREGKLCDMFRSVARTI